RRDRGRTDHRCGARRSSGALYGEPATRRQRLVHDRHGQQDAVRRPGVTSLTLRVSVNGILTRSVSEAISWIATVRGVALARARDDELQAYLSQAGVEWNRLDETGRQEAEETWRRIYSHAFRGRPRLRHGAKAEYEYQREPCTLYFIVPFSANVPGLP